MTTKDQVIEAAQIYGATIRVSGMGQEVQTAWKLFKQALDAYHPEPPLESIFGGDVKESK